MSRRIAPILVLVSLAAGCFSAFNVSRYRSPEAAAAPIETIAIAPLWVVAATETKNAMTWTPGWLSQSSATLPMSPAEIEPAQAVMVQGLRSALGAARLIEPAAVDGAMRGVTGLGEADAVREIATRTEAGGVIVVRVRNFDQRHAGLENAQASGTTDVTLYDAAGRVIWSLAAEVVRGPAGSNAAPSLGQFMEYAMERFEPEIAAMMRSP